MRSRYMSAEDERKFILSQGEKPIEVRCAICKEMHYRGAGYYPLQKVNGYNLFCCAICYDGNWDGWKECHEPVLIERLKELGVEPPPRNEDGLLPFQF